jgi:hypothetical protein
MKLISQKEMEFVQHGGPKLTRRNEKLYIKHLNRNSTKIEI